MDIIINLASRVGECIV